MCLKQDGKTHKNINMKFVISSSELLRGVQAVAKAIPSKPIDDILGSILFELEENKLTLTASDSELTLKTSLEVESSNENGRMAAVAKLLIELLRELPDQPLSIETISDNCYECRWTSGNSQLQYLPADDYPKIKGTDDDAITIDFPSQCLTDGISSTIYAATDDDNRPIMNGIFFDFSSESTTLVASDAHKLICYTIKDVKVEQNASFILHKKPAGILKNVIDKSCETVRIKFDSKNVSFSFGQSLVICRQIVGRYPKYRDVIPQNNSNTLRIDRVMFLNAIRRISVCANKASSLVKFSMTENSLELTAQDLGFSVAAYEKVNCRYDGENLEIGFKSTFLIEILSNMSCNELVMKFSDSRRAVLIIPAEDEAENENLCGIIMPISFS